MRCPFCGNDNDKVIDSRSTDQSRCIRRRRQCLECDKRFTTYEHIETATRLTVIKKDGNRMPYDRQKMLKGIESASYKRPVSTEQLVGIVDEVEEELFKKGVREIDAMEIGRMLADRLKRLDQVAYVRFASVYKQFKDLDDLLDEVRDVIEGVQPESPQQGKLF